MSAARKKVAVPTPEPKDVQEYLDMLEQPKWLQQILIAQDGFSALQLAKLISNHVRTLQNHNGHLAQDNKSMKAELERLRDKHWNALDDDIKMSLIREHAGAFVKVELGTYEKTNVSLRRQLQRLQAALERGLCERG